MDIDLSAVSRVANFKFDEFKEILRAVVRCVCVKSSCIQRIPALLDR